MAQIQILDPLVADMIAAGEVVERPASVVKELAENSIDAGAGKITVEIKNGGVRFLRISDDGCGIDEKELPIAFLRHATSKIQTADDLFAIGTLGFRGEALASIAAVSQVEILTKPRQQKFGRYLCMRAGEQVDSHEAGCPDGTTMTVRDLFFNQPARMKFLKKDAAEGAAVQDVMVHLALGNPGVSFRFLADGKEKLHTPGDGSLKNCIYQIYGRDYIDELAELTYEHEGVRITGFCGTPAIARSTRSYQTFFVNGRLVKSRGITAALEQAYQDGMMKGKHPFAVINITLERSLTDVNVHPAKLEVKFSNEKAVTGAVYWAVKNALHQQVYQPEIQVASVSVPVTEAVDTPAEKTVTPPKTEPPAQMYQVSVTEDVVTLPVIDEVDPWEAPEKKSVQNKLFAPRWVEPSEKTESRPPEPLTPSAPPVLRQPVVSQPEDVVPEQPAEQTAAQPAEQGIRVIGQVFQSYLIAQRGEEMLLIDQHAAHERLLFEQLVKQREEQSVHVQGLLHPIVIEMTPSEFAAAQEELSLLEKLGFETEEFGECTLRLRGVPLCSSEQDGKQLFWETLHALQNAGKRGDRESEALYSMACHAALKANHSLQPREMEQLVKDALALPSTCPHGRPIVAVMTKKMLEKQFKRIV